ncbi:MAG: GNAT family N-acetyltransferase [Verrucomicrobia bacterium]|nr:GNAT family N-acetyltransferase [Verrucomicrobiota bacterium]
MRIRLVVFDRATSEPKEAVIRPMTFTDAIAAGEWKHPPDAPDKGWNWSRMFMDSAVYPESYESYALTVNDELHGLMALNFAGGIQEAERAVILDYLATNPVNRQTLTGWKEIGKALVGAALIRSAERGRVGQIYLESKPEAAGFYENLGFQKLEGVSMDNLPRYFLNSKRSRELLAMVKERLRFHHEDKN